MRIRPARADEADLLGSISFESKAYWPYPPEAMAGWRDALVVRLEPRDRRPAFVAEADGEIAGFCQLVLEGDEPELEHLWVRPAWIGKGVGRTLLGRAGALLAELGHVRMRIDADPNAEAFYLHCGAMRQGEVAAPIPGDGRRVRPQLLLDVARLLSSTT